MQASGPDFTQSNSDKIQKPEPIQDKPKETPSELPKQTQSSSSIKTPITTSQSTPAVGAVSKAAPQSNIKAIQQTNAHYSRNFLIGKTPQKPAYQSVSEVNSVTPANLCLLVANEKYLVFPLAGPGGRLATHAIKETGRTPLPPKHVECGSSITAFSLDPFDQDRLYTATEEGVIHVWNISTKESKELRGSYLSSISMRIYTKSRPSNPTHY